MSPVQGVILSGDAAEETKDVLLLDVASLSLGIEVRSCLQCTTAVLYHFARPLAFSAVHIGCMVC